MSEADTAKFKRIADALNSVVALPKDVYLSMDTCGYANAFYATPEFSQLIVCYEYIEEFRLVYQQIEKDPEKVEKMVSDAFVHTLFHEIGHCLISVWQLPATGREEDAVDQLATIIMLDGTDEGQKSLLNANKYWYILSRARDSNLKDEHSPDLTRFYDTICLIYGSDPKKNAFMVGDDKLPKSRADRCPGEYKKIEWAWMTLLAPITIK